MRYLNTDNWAIKTLFNVGIKSDRKRQVEQISKYNFVDKHHDST